MRRCRGAPIDNTAAPQIVVYLTSTQSAIALQDFV
jgi:hypothetical protein